MIFSVTIQKNTLANHFKPTVDYNKTAALVGGRAPQISCSLVVDLTWWTPKSMSRL